MTGLVRNQKSPEHWVSCQRNRARAASPCRSHKSVSWECAGEMAAKFATLPQCAGIGAPLDLETLIHEVKTGFTEFLCNVGDTLSAPPVTAEGRGLLSLEAQAV